MISAVIEPVMLSPLQPKANQLFQPLYMAFHASVSRRCSHQQQSGCQWLTGAGWRWLAAGWLVRAAAAERITHIAGVSDKPLSSARTGHSASRQHVSIAHIATIAGATAARHHPSAVNSASQRWHDRSREPGEIKAYRYHHILRTV